MSSILSFGFLMTGLLVLGFAIIFTVRRDHQLGERDRQLTGRDQHLADRERFLAERELAVASRERDLVPAEAAQRAAEQDRSLELERVAGLTAAQARAELITGLEDRAKREAARSIADIERGAIAEADRRARGIIATAVQRLAFEQGSESVTSVLRLPADDLKGRIIGRDGRNIKAFEALTGVNLVIDETPEAVTLSCFDPLRRETARLALERLVGDGRITPPRIEEAFRRGQEDVDKKCRRAAEDTLSEFGITDLHPELATLLGTLAYRSSYGQNVLSHLIESAHIVGLLAAELRMDSTLVTRAALLHDIGKAVTHARIGDGVAPGSHALVGADMARRYGEAADVVHAIEAHHDEVPPGTIEAVLTQAADAISGGRPGARRESLQRYIRRMERIEQIAGSRDGVAKVYAMQAGREVRVMVRPEDVDDIGAQVIARDIAKQVAEELTFPGRIRITVIRESRATEYAR